jgi:hypothetical protein
MPLLMIIAEAGTPSRNGERFLAHVNCQAPYRRGARTPAASRVSLRFAMADQIEEFLPGGAGFAESTEDR